MTLNIIDGTRLYEFPTGRRRWALKRTRAATVELGVDDPGLRSALERCIAADGELWQLEKRWRRKSYRVEHGPRAVELDRMLDEQLVGLEQSLRSRARLVDALPESAAEAQRCLDSIFPDGVGAITRSSYIEQAEDTEVLLEKLREESFSRLMEELGLTPLIAKIEEVYAAYADELGRGGKIDFKEIEARRRQGHVALGEVIARIHGLFPTESEEDRRRRGALMAPIYGQNEALKLIYKERRRGGRKLDDDIGDEVISDDDIGDEAIGEDGLAAGDLGDVDLGDAGAEEPEPRSEAA